MPKFRLNFFLVNTSFYSQRALDDSARASGTKRTAAALRLPDAAGRCCVIMRYLRIGLRSVARRYLAAGKGCDNFGRRKWFGDKDAVRHTLRTPVLGTASADVDDGEF